jgi:hypothetical protein
VPVGNVRSRSRIGEIGRIKRFPADYACAKHRNVMVTMHVGRYTMLRALQKIAQSTVGCKANIS